MKAGDTRAVDEGRGKDRSVGNENVIQSKVTGRPVELSCDGGGWGVYQPMDIPNHGLGKSSGGVAKGKKSIFGDQRR